MSLLAAILNQTTKILSMVIGINSNTSNIQASVENGMTTQGYTTGRAPNLDDLPIINANTQPTAIASDVQTGLSDQGYTPTRATNLDTLTNLNATVSSRRPIFTTKRFSQIVTVPIESSATIFSLSGPGIIQTLFVSGETDAYVSQIIIDGTLTFSYNTNQANYWGPDGSTSLSSVMLLQWEFKSSFSITGTSFNTSGNTFNLAVTYAQ